MLCRLVNHSHVHEIQTITQLFFPNTRFTFMYDDAMPQGLADYAVESVLETSGCAGAVYHNDVALAVHFVPLASDLPVTRSLMLALFFALKKAIDAYVPWGALTGIRPSKLVRQWLGEGQTGEDITKKLVDVYQCHENKALLALTVALAEDRLSEQIAAAAPDGKTAMGLYISIPYCPSRCLYCSFNTCNKPAREDQHRAYLEALLLECACVRDKALEMDGSFTAIYIGGGTPTVLSEPLLEQLLDGIAALFSPLIVPTVEYTVEAGRPDSLTPAKLRIMKNHGVTRIAVNPQTLNDHTLALIGRSHSVRDFYTAFEAARREGFDNINTDLIAGLPGEGPDDMRRTMKGLTALSPESITVHTLAVKRASRLNENLSAYPVPTVAETERMLDMAAEACGQAGLFPYYLYRQKNMVGLFENVGYAKPGCECLYNVGMMAETQTILAAGAGAVNKFVNGTRIDRVFNVKNSEVYIERTHERICPS